ncbi:MFS multidrug transporter [Coccidioides immitis RS]|uniref:MFS multidrug transporter n=3 Tax=Coccidioides immitis TaxID=5501 RepID=J3KHH6_COCIM|nr:MFS multidrug transporter [Coccidioides immitis RS]EAS35316.3 MFS multidrug transporter [Coccidioides immitis RS]KMP00564.1 multidrug resistance protein fnx1 [Coccidioides immitis RMSCC 2394]KMU75916.1 multidrug resistance protein fnx1 [Coccidioides immitis RMSCC 3703]
MSSPRRVTESTPLLHNGTASVPDIPDDIDEESLDRDLANVQSVPHGGETEPGFPPVPPRDGASEAAKQTTPKGSHHFINVSPAQFWVIFTGILFSYIIAFFDSTLMGSIHPVVTSYFNSSNSASWLSTGFLLTCTAFQPLFGRVSDTFGRRPVYLFAIFVFFITTAWCALAQSIGSFIAARVCCGLGAGAVASLGMIMSSDLIYVEYRGIYQSYINLAYGTGSSLGLAFGGLLADKLGWRAAFGIQLPFIFIYLVAAYFTTPQSLGPQLAYQEGFSLMQAIKSIDLKGSFLLVTGVTALMLGINLGGNVLSWDHPLVICSLAAFGAIVALFIKVEREAKRPVMPLPLLSSFPRANLILGNFCANITINTVLFNAPLYFQAVKLESPTNAGFRLVGASLMLMISSVFTGLLMTKTRRLKPPLILGSICLIYGTCSMSMLRRDAPGWIGMLSVSPASFGQGFAFPATMLSVLAVSEQGEQAVVTTTLGLFRNLGSVMGVAISSWVLQNSLRVYLNLSVTGDDKAEIIQRVRRSVAAISELDPIHQYQVIEAYERALRITFLSSIVSSALVFLLVAPVRLPRLRRR